MKKSKKFVLFTLMISSAVMLYPFAKSQHMYASGQPVAMIQDTPYATLTEAIAAGKENDTITLVDDTTITGSTDGDFRNGSKVSLDLNNHIVYGDNGNGALRVMDNENVRICNGTVIAKQGTYSTIMSGLVNGTVPFQVDVENMQLKNSMGNGVSIKAFAGSSIVLKNVTSESVTGGGVEAAGGTVEVYNSTFTQSGYFNWNSVNLASSNGGIVNVYDGSSTFQSENYGLYVFNSGGTINVYGGTFRAGKAVLKADKSIEQPISKININGGSFDGAIQIQEGAFLNIKKGTFKNTGLSLVEFAKYVDKDSVVGEDHGVYTVTSRVKTLTLTPAKAVMEAGTTKQLQLKKEPTNTIEKVQWVSSDEAVTNVTAEGLVTAKKAGTTTITASIGSIQAQTKITVFETTAPHVPNVDPTKPSDTITAGIQDKQSQAVIDQTTNKLVSSILNDEAVKNVDKETIQNVKAAVDAGQAITTKVEVTAVDEATIDKKVVQDIKAELAVEAKQNGSDIKVAQFLDLRVMLMADGKELGTINELTGKITFTITLPEDLKMDGRKYYIVRVHEGDTEMIEARVNKDGTLSFETDKFSTYALAYEDVKNTAKPDTAKPDTKPNTTTKKPTSGVKTGDTTNTSLYYAMMIGSIALMGIVAVLYAKMKLLYVIHGLKVRM